MIRSPRRSSLVAAVLAALMGVALTAAPAVAAPAAGQITWAVKPAPGPDGKTRAAVVNELDPGQSASDSFTVTNLSAERVTFQLTSADGFLNSDGRFDILPSDTPSVDAGTWITLPDEVTIDPSATVDVPFTVSVPEDAEPGDHIAGIAAVLITGGQDESGSNVDVESRVGFRVTTRVTGEALPAVEISSVTSDYRLNWNPFQPGRLTIDYTLRNTGNLRFTVAGQVSAQGHSVDYQPAAGQSATELFPGDERQLSQQIDDIWPLFLVPGDISIDPQVTLLDGTPIEVEPTVASFTAVAIPLPQLLVLLGLALIIGAVFWDRRRSRKRTEELVAEAREEGRREAELGGGDTAAPVI